LSNRTTAEFRGFEQVERSVQYFNLRSRPPNEPTAHDVRMQGAHEHRYSPERNATLDKPVTQLCDHVVGLHCRSRTIDEPIHNRLYVTTSHHTRPSCAKLRWDSYGSEPPSTNNLEKELMRPWHGLRKTIPTSIAANGTEAVETHALKQCP